jgi:hypothetical protein
MGDGFKLKFTAECLPLFDEILIPFSLIMSCLLQMEDSYKTSFIAMLLPRIESLSSHFFTTMLNEISYIYKASFISTCLPYLKSSLSGQDLSMILDSCPDKFKFGIIESMGNKIEIESLQDVVDILSNTSDYYKDKLTTLLMSHRIVKKLIDKPATKEETKCKTTAVNYSKMTCYCCDENVDEQVPETDVQDCYIISSDDEDEYEYDDSDSVDVVHSDRITQFMGNDKKPVMVKEQKTDDVNMSVVGRDCVVCLDKKAEWVIVPCGHKICCENCVKTILNCPMCRSVKTLAIKVFE